MFLDLLKPAYQRRAPQARLAHRATRGPLRLDAPRASDSYAIADEMQRVYQKELGPQSIPLVVPGEAIDEEYGTDDDDEQNENQDDDGDVDADSLKTKRVTRVVLNRRARRKERLKMEAEAKKLKGLSKDIDSILNHIMQEIAKEDDEKDKRHLPRIVAKQERLKTHPFRFGKYKFEPAPLQVLLTEEKIGSLQQLKIRLYACSRSFQEPGKKRIDSPHTEG
ncbi:hypothetical protein OROMI_008106 [Orobanche minor]